MESSFRKFHLKITIVCTKAKMVHFPFFLAPTGALVFNVYPYKNQFLTIAQKSRMAANLRIKPTATKSGIWKYFDDCLDGQPKFKRIQFSLGRWNAQIGDETCQLSRGTCQNFSPSLLSPWESLSSRSSGDLCKMDQTDLYFSWRLISYFSALIWTNLTTALLDRVIISY